MSMQADTAVLSGAAPEPAADARFGFAILGQLAAGRDAGNVLIAPRNIRSALAAVAVGAEGETGSEIVTRTNSYDDIDNAPGKSFRNALHIWVWPGQALKEDFRAHFKDARIDSTAPDDAPAIVNAYVRERTGGKIDEILTSAPEGIGIVLTTVFDFEGKWRFAFDPKQSYDDNFFVAPDAPLTVRFMARRGEYHYAETDEGQIVRLPYRDDGLVMTLFLPKAPLRVEDWLQAGTGEAWQALVAAMTPHDGLVALPRLKSLFSAELTQALQALGIRRAFTSAAEFTGILDAPLKIDRVLHKAMLKIDEQGTEAAAATSIGMRATAMQINRPEPFEMKLDRPFLLTIGDALNRKILFMGVVREPGEEK
jgi:serpin B